MRCAMILGTLSLVVSSARAQSIAAMSGQIEQLGSCRKCTMAAERFLTLGDADDPELILDRATIAILPDGRPVVGNNGNQGLLLSYSPSGKYSGTIGRTGEGPGEYRNIRRLFAGPADSITIFGSNIVAIVSAATGTGRSMHTAGFSSTGFVRLTSGTFVVNTEASKRGAFSVFDKDFHQQAVFGPVLTTNNMGATYLPIYSMAPASNGDFWAATMEFTHRIERWSLSGRIVQRLDSLPSWFKPYTYTDAYPASGFRPYVTRPVPRIVAIREQRGGELWVITVLPDAKWKPVQNVPTFSTQAESLSYQPPPDPNRHMDTIVEVFTITSGRLLGSWRFHRTLEGFAADGILFSRRSDEDGVNHFDLWRLALRGQ